MSSRAEAMLRSRTQSVVRSAKKRSAKFIQELPVGVKCGMTGGCRFSHWRTFSCLWIAWLCLTRAVPSATDAAKAIITGAKVLMMTSTLLDRGISYLDTIATELLIWMSDHEYDSVRQKRGSVSRPFRTP